MYRSARLVRARAMASRCFWPPEKFLPPCSTRAWSPPGRLSTKPAWATARAWRRSSSPAWGLPWRRFSATVPEKSQALWGT